MLACMVAGYASKKVGALIEFPRRGVNERPGDGVLLEGLVEGLDVGIYLCVS